MSEKNETILQVEGMSCGSCIRHVNEALREVDGVRDVEVELKQGTVRVQHDEGAAVGSFIEALTEAGYPSRPAA